MGRRQQKFSLARRPSAARATLAAPLDCEQRTMSGSFCEAASLDRELVCVCAFSPACARTLPGEAHVRRCWREWPEAPLARVCQALAWLRTLPTAGPMNSQGRPRFSWAARRALEYNVDTSLPTRRTGRRRLDLVADGAARTIAPWPNASLVHLLRFVLAAVLRETRATQRLFATAAAT